jgi:type VI secretion system protein VasD
MARRLLVGCIFGALAGLAACGAPPPPPPTVVNVSASASADVNPSPDNTPAPIAVRIYQLTSGANFGAAEFFALYNSDAATLKTDIVHRDDLLLAPGQSKTLTLKPDPTVKTIGVFAGYRDFQHATWRGSVDVEPNKTTNVTVTAGRAGVTVKATPAQ